MGKYRRIKFQPWIQLHLTEMGSTDNELLAGADTKWNNYNFTKVSEGFLAQIAAKYTFRIAKHPFQPCETNVSPNICTLCCDCYKFINKIFLVLLLRRKLATKIPRFSKMI